MTWSVRALKSAQVENGKAAREFQMPEERLREKSIIRNGVTGLAGLEFFQIIRVGRLGQSKKKHRLIQDEVRRKEDDKG